MGRGFPIARPRVPRNAALAALAILASVGVLAVCCGIARASLTVESFGMSASTPQAGTHPDISFSFALGNSGEAAETAKTAVLSAPPGYFLEPNAIPACGAAQLASLECPNSSLVGLATLDAEYEGEPSSLLGTFPVYMLERSGVEIDRFGIATPFSDPVELAVTMRTTSDYGLDLKLEKLPETAPFTSLELRLWGVPAAPSHDATRPSPIECIGMKATGCVTAPRPPGLQQVPLLLNPTRCGVPPSTSLGVTTYEHPEVLVSSMTSSPFVTGCNKLAFSPALLVGLTSAEADSPTGLSFGIQEPSWPGPEILEPAEIRDVELELPPGLIVDPEAAEEHPTCTYEQFGFGVDEPDECPAGSAVGTFSVAIGEFEPTLEGTAYLGVTEPETYRLLLTASGPIGTIKLVSRLEEDGEEEQVTLVFYELPQVPLRDLNLELDPGAELLLTPTVCGKYFATSDITPWSGGPHYIVQNPLTIDKSCTHEESPGVETRPSTQEQPSLNPSRPQTGPSRKPRPRARLTKRPGRHTRDRTPTFRFRSTARGSTFRCRIDGRPFHRCTSPTTLRRLTSGPHTFRVQAVDPNGQASAPTIWRFHVRRR